MCDVVLRKSTVVSLPVAFNTIGRLLYGKAWRGHEVVAIRLGQQSKARSDARQRGLKALDVMRILAEDGRVGLFYTDEAGRRVPYFQSRGPWLTNLYPDPMGIGEGQIELGDREIRNCVADVSSLKPSLFVKPGNPKTGPKGKYSAFDAACAQFFRDHSIQFLNKAVWDFVRKIVKLDEPWPGKSWGNDLINAARDAQHAADLSRTPD